MRTFIKMAAVLLVLRIASPSILSATEKLLLETIEILRAVIQTIHI